MTEEEARAAGWPEEEIPGYLRGREKGAALAGRIMAQPWERQPPAPAETAAPGTPEYRAHELAAGLVAQSDAADTAVRLRLVAQEATAVITDHPGMEPSAMQQREWALAQLAERGIPIVPDERPKQDFVITMPDGTAKVVRQVVPPVGVVFTPGNADEAARWFARQQRERENKLLVAAYGERACREAGIL